MAQKTPIYKFGEYPLHITLSSDGEQYELDPEEVKLGEPVGIPETFAVSQFPIMCERARAHGYDLQIEEVPATIVMPVTRKDE
jgi:hypothetical protein